jgi:hypothetical protein
MRYVNKFNIAVAWLVLMTLTPGLIGLGWGPSIVAWVVIATVVAFMYVIVTLVTYYD